MHNILSARDGEVHSFLQTLKTNNAQQKISLSVPIFQFPLYRKRIGQLKHENNTTVNKDNSYSNSNGNECLQFACDQCILDSVHRNKWWDAINIIKELCDLYKTSISAEILTRFSLAKAYHFISNLSPEELTGGYVEILHDHLLNCDKSVLDLSSGSPFHQLLCYLKGVMVFARDDQQLLLEYVEQSENDDVFGATCDVFNVYLKALYNRSKYSSLCEELSLHNFMTTVIPKLDKVIEQLP
eukprot:Pgem_evm1s4961